MSNSTQNDWEKELLQALILDQPPVEVMFIKGVENLVRTCTWSQLVAVVDKFRADARKEVKAKIEKLRKDEWGRFPSQKEADFYFPSQKEADFYSGRECGYNEAIDDVLATLREEEGV